MEEHEIYAAWTEFINDPRYKKYFKTPSKKSVHLKPKKDSTTTNVELKVALATNLLKHFTLPLLKI